MKHVRSTIVAMLLGGAVAATAQVQNYALRFEGQPEAVTNLGSVQGLANAEHYTLQLWFNPDRWTQGASIVRCGTFSIKLGVEHAIVINDGSNHLTITSSQIGTGKWTQLTLRSSESGTIATLNNSQTFTAGTPIALPATDKSVWLGGNFAGRIDEVRIWDGTLPEEYNSYWQNTLNELNPSYSSLLGYWKMDQELCANVVDYKGSSHGTMAAGVSKTPVNDNQFFKYRVNLAYGNVQRFFDRKIDARHYSLSNRIAIIGAALNTTTGAVTLHNPRYDAELIGSRLDAYSGRNGVVTGGINVPGEVLAEATTYTIEAWINPESLNGNTTIIKKGEALSMAVNADGKITVTIKGTSKTCSGLTIPAGQWTHVALVSAGSGNVTVYAGDKSECLTFGSSDIKSTEKTEICVNGSVILDDVMFWNSVRTAANLAEDAARMPLADAEHAVTGSLVWNMVAAYNFESATEPGFDRFSVQNWFRTMRSYTEGMRGVRYFLTVNAESFDGCLANATLRNKAIADMSELAKIDEFDGIDLDFEWPNNGWGNIATVIEGIKANLPEGKMVTVSPHQVYYNYPANRMDAPDAFNFQNYGPNNKNLFTRAGFQDAANKFINQGFPREKIIMSYATTTSGGMNQGGTRVPNSNAAFYPAGYRSIYKEGVTQPSDDQIASAAGDCYYFLTGFDQTVYRAQYIVDNDLGGIFYWDLGNDLNATHPASLARAASYAVNSNVEALVTEVESAAPAPGQDPNGPTETADPDDQGGFDPAEGAEAIRTAIDTYSHRSGYAANGSPERTNLLHLINMALLGQIDGSTLETARQSYLATAPSELQGPKAGRKYYLINVNTYDPDLRYLHITGTALDATASPTEFGEKYEWEATANADGSFTLSHDGYYITSTLALSQNAADAYSFPILAGNKHGRLQLQIGDKYVETHYTGNNSSSLDVVLEGTPNNDASNPKKWTGQWMIAEVSSLDLAVPELYTINSGHEEGGIVYNEEITLGHGESFYLDPEIDNVLTAKQTTLTKSEISIDHSFKTISIDYSGLNTAKVYRLRNARFEQADEYMTMADNGTFATARLAENNASQIFAVVACGDGKWGLSVQNTYVGTNSTTQQIQLTKASIPGSYYLVEHASGRYAFDRIMPNGGTWADGSCALSAPGELGIISSWGTGPIYSWWYPEEVTEFEIPSIGGYAAICLPFTVTAAADVYTAAVIDNVVVLTRTDRTVPAHTPVIVAAPSEKVTLSVEGSGAAEQHIAGNQLAGYYPGDNAPAYALAVKDGAPMFVAGATAANNSAVLPTGLASAAQLPIEVSTATMIEEVTAAGANGIIYDLQGRRVSTPRRGIYLINGKKVLIK